MKLDYVKVLQQSNQIKICISYLIKFDNNRITWWIQMNNSKWFTCQTIINSNDKILNKDVLIK